MLIEKLEAIKVRRDEVEQELGSPTVMSDMKRFAGLSKEYKDLTPIVEAMEDYRNVLSNIESSREVLMNEKCITALIKSTESTDDETRFNACFAINKLATNTENLNRLLEASLIPHLVDVLMNAGKNKEEIMILMS